MNHSEHPGEIPQLTWWILGFVIALILCGTLLSSCNTPQRLYKSAAANPDAAASMCARMFPVRESAAVRIERRTDTVTLPGEVMFVDCDSAQARRLIHDTVRLRVAVRCPERQVITNTVTRDSVVRVENTAAVTAARNEARAATIQAAKAGKARQMWMWAAIGLFAYSVIRLVLRYWLKIALP